MRIGSGGGMGDADLVDILTDGDGNDVYYYGDGGVIVMDPGGNVLDTYNNTEATGGGAIDTGSTGTVNPGDPDNTAATIKTKTGVSVQVQNDGSIKLPPNVTNDVVNQVIAAAAKAGGQWVARQINGQTLLYRSNAGIGTFDLGKSMPLIIGVGALLMMKG